MPIVTYKDWEKAEVKRSAFEASHIDTTTLIADEKDTLRYLNPPAETPFPLEYCYHLLHDLRGKTLLEYGCGDGMNTVVLARRGARVKALDISPELIQVAQQRLDANLPRADVEFIVGSAHDIPLPDESVDIVFGMAILHHLDLALSAREVYRVLRPGGRAIFQEPVRNSGLLRFIRKLIPYQQADVSPFERPLTDAELAEYGRAFRVFRSKPFWFPTTSFLSTFPAAQKLVFKLSRSDHWVLKKLPVLSHFTTVRVIELVK